MKKSQFMGKKSFPATTNTLGRHIVNTIEANLKTTCLQETAVYNTRSASQYDQSPTETSGAHPVTLDESAPNIITYDGNRYVMNLLKDSEIDVRHVIHDLVHQVGHGVKGEQAFFVA